MAAPTRWGRHELRPADAASLVAAAGIRPGDLVLDLGAGRGALTAPLLAAGARVVANLPFATTAAAMRRLLDPRGALVRADVELRPGSTIRASRFRPPPSVDASVLIVTRR